jgi:hypothetical protein
MPGQPGEDQHEPHFQVVSASGDVFSNSCGVTGEAILRLRVNAAGARSDDRFVALNPFSRHKVICGGAQIPFLERLAKTLLSFFLTLDTSLVRLAILNSF